MTNASSPTRHYLGVYLPWLPAERVIRTRAALRDTPFALINTTAGGIRVAAVSPAAAPLGLVGLALADARARLPALVTVEHDPAADVALQAWLADGCERFTPSVAVDGSNGLLLDMTGCSFEADAVIARLAHHGVTARAAIAVTPDAASALAEFAVGEISTLPIAALRADTDIHRALRRAGLTTIGALARLPRAPLAARFGAAVATRLTRLLGDADIRLIPRRAPPAIVRDHRAAEPILTVAGATSVIDRLLIQVAADLAARGHGGRAFAVTLFRSDGHVARLRIDTSAPTRSPALIHRLLDERIAALADPLDPGFGFDHVRLAVLVTEPLAEAQLDLDGGSIAADAVAALIDRLTTRLGASRVRRLAIGDSHIPEQAAFDLAIGARDIAAWPPPVAGEPPSRPLHLFTPPQRIEVIAEVPDGPPRWFRWHRVRHDVTRAEGPERIAAEWWRRRDGQGLTRDYYRVENVHGRRFWLFRHGLYGDEVALPGWYLHGLFA